MYKKIHNIIMYFCKFTGPDESPFILLRTGDNQTLSLLLYNFGQLSTFKVVVASETNSSRFSYRLTNSNGTNVLDQISLGMGEVANINLEIEVLGNVTDSDSDRLTILVFDTASSERSDFINVEVSGTTIPPIDNVSYYYRMNILFHSLMM